MKFFILLLCLNFGAQITWAKTVYYKAESKIVDEKNNVTTNQSVGKIDIGTKLIDYLDYMYEKPGMPVTKTDNYLRVIDEKRGAIHWSEPKREPFFVDLVYTNGKLTGQSAKFKDRAGRDSFFKSTLTDTEYSYSLTVYGENGKKYYTMNSNSTFITKEEYEATLKKLKIFDPKEAAPEKPKTSP